MNGGVSSPLLQTKGLKAHLDGTASLQGLDLSLQAEDAIALIGEAGCGASLALRAIAGLVLPSGGEVSFRGNSIEGLSASEIAQMGIGFVPKRRRVFARMTVYENLDVGRRAGKGGNFDRVFNLIPSLAAMKTRFAGDLDPVEQKMLIIGRTLMGNPNLILLDEPVDGFDRAECEEIIKLLTDIRGEGVGLLLAEEEGACHRSVCDRALLIEDGKVERVIEIEAPSASDEDEARESVSHRDSFGELGVLR